VLEPSLWSRSNFGWLELLLEPKTFMVVVVGCSCCWSLLLEMAEPAAGDGCSRCWSLKLLWWSRSLKFGFPFHRHSL